MELTGTQRVILRIGVLIAASTILLTCSFVGFIAALSGQVQGFENRVPWYLITAAAVFVTTIVLLEINDADGKTIIISAVVVGGIAFVLVFLAVEGAIFAINNPGTLIFSRLIVYFLAAALVATGVGYWGLRHWREFTANNPESL
jgi:hypothetical protein